MNKIIPILLTLLLLMLILNHAKDESKSGLEKMLFEELSNKAKYGNGRLDPSTLPPLTPSGIKATDYEPTDRPTTAPPPGTPSWCPPPQKIGSPPVDKVDTECIY